MTTERENFLRHINILADLVLMSATFFLGHYLRYRINPIYSVTFYLVIYPSFILTYLGALKYFGLYRLFRLKNFTHHLRAIAKSTLCSFILMSTFLYIFRIEGVSRLMMFFVYTLSFSILSLKSFFLMKLLHMARKKGYRNNNILIVGTGKQAHDFCRRIRLHPEWGINIVGILDRESSRVGRVIEGHRVIGTLHEIKDIIHSHAIDRVICIIPNKWIRDMHPIVSICENEGIDINISVNLYELQYFRPYITEFAGLPLVSYKRNNPDPFMMGLKRVFDVVISLSILILTFPLLCVIAALVKATSDGPVFYKQMRYGLNGRKFSLIKFRTMVLNSEDRLKELKAKNEMTGPAFKIKDDPRLTPIGKILRKFSLDEFPQFLNVLKGDMSIVGPRPPIIDEVHEYDDWQRRRLRVRPGLTCLWQISGRNNIKEFDKWVSLDLQYIDNWSFGLDLKIFLKTIPVVLSGNGAK